MVVDSKARSSSSTARQAAARIYRQTCLLLLLLAVMLLHKSPLNRRAKCHRHTHLSRQHHRQATTSSTASSSKKAWNSSSSRCSSSSRYSTVLMNSRSWAVKLSAGSNQLRLRSRHKQQNRRRSSSSRVRLCQRAPGDLLTGSCWKVLLPLPPPTQQALSPATVTPG